MSGEDSLGASDGSRLAAHAGERARPVPLTHPAEAAALWMREGERWPRIARLAAESLALLAPVPCAAEAHAAYELLRQAALARSRRRTRRQLERCRHLVSGGGSAATGATTPPPI